jgi:hypothetical protein
MLINISDRAELLDSQSRQLVERRLLFALSRFDSRIQQIDLTLNDENGPRGGIDKSCRLLVVLHRAADVVITDRDSDVISCISRVAGRAGRAVSRGIARSNDITRSRPAFVDPQTITQT